DRVAAINIIGTKTVVIITLIAQIYEQIYFLDVAMVYALMSFITTIGVAKYLEKGALD
ncbi:MAG: monovalent cation/H+ antiporter complex subunit F, partial [Dethiobacteria bacterium]